MAGILLEVVGEHVERADPDQADQEAPEHADHDAAAATQRGLLVGADGQAEEDQSRSR